MRGWKRFQSFFVMKNNRRKRKQFMRKKRRKVSIFEVSLTFIISSLNILRNRTITKAITTIRSGNATIGEAIRYRRKETTDKQKSAKAESETKAERCDMDLWKQEK